MITLKKHNITENGLRERQRLRQNRVTKMLFLVVMQSFFLQVIPMFIIFLMTLNENVGHLFSRYAGFIYTYQKLNSANNIIIYMYKNEEINRAIRSFLRNPENHSKSTVKPIELKFQSLGKTSKTSRVRKDQPGIT